MGPALYASESATSVTFLVVVAIIVPGRSAGFSAPC